MPYQGEFANKASHSDIIKNPDVAAFLAECEYLREPSDEEGQAIAEMFSPTALGDPQTLPERIVAVDGSVHESSIDDKLPSSKVGYIKVSAMMIMLSEFGDLRTPDRKFVDPFKVAALQRNKDSLLIVLPSANVLKGKKSVRDSFRAVLDAYLYGENTRFVANDPDTSLRTTLFHLASHRHGGRDTMTLTVSRCPSCSEQDVKVKDVPEPQFCPACKNEIYPSDCLRLWEEVSDFQSSYQALSRCMLQVEHMLPIHWARHMMKIMPNVLGDVAFFMDGPLAVFGNGAWLSRAIMSYLDTVRKKLHSLGRPDLLMIGLQKTGQVVDHVTLIEKYVPRERILPIADDYRYEHIVQRTEAKNGFGDEDYYGQDFIYKSKSGRNFVFGIPYPVASKSGNPSFHKTFKTDMANYPNLSRALALINHFESDLYRNAVIPIALAHRYTAISLSPGGKVLDLMTRTALQNNQRS
ncbi:MAG: hypothetical protein SFU56_11075 [Capsulimonadales bacterium]|nr:hypothetical protein [Capsulimonadales bacterium]